MNIILDEMYKIAYVNISPIKAVFNDDCECTRLYVISHSDNNYNQAEFTYHLTCDDGIFHYTGRCIICDSNYSNWSGDNQTPFSFVANCINATIID